MKSLNLLLVICLLVSCSKGTNSKLSESFMSAEVSSVGSILINNQSIVLNGQHLKNITAIKVVKKNQPPVKLILESKEDNKLVAKLSQNLSMVIGEAFSLVLDSASGSSIVDAIFTIGQRTIPINSLIGVLGTGGVEGDTIAWDSRTNSWKTTPGGNQTYLGAFDASPGGHIVEDYPKTGDFYLVEKAGSRDINGTGSVFYSIGDKIIFNGSEWDLIKGTIGVTSFKGRNGIVVPVDGDYSWSMLTKNPNSNKIAGSSLSDISDVDIVMQPVDGDILTYSNGSWVSRSLPVVVTPEQLSDVSNSVGTKEPTLPSGVVADYLRGDKTFQKLDTSVVPELNNLYFTNARAIQALTETLSSYSTTSAVSNTLSNYALTSQLSNYALSSQLSGYALSSDLNSYVKRTDLDVSLNSYVKNTNLADTLILYKNSVDTTAQIASAVDTKVDKDGSTMTGDLILSTSLKFKSNNSNNISIKAPNSSAAYSLTLPSSLGGDGQVLTLGSAGVLSWQTPTATPNVTRETLGLDLVPNIDATKRENHTGSQVSSTISDFAQAVRDVTMSGFSTVVSSMVSVTDSVSEAINKLQAQILLKADQVNLDQKFVAKKISLGTISTTSKSSLYVLNDATSTGITPDAGSTQVDSIILQDQFSGDYSTNNGFVSRVSRGSPIAPLAIQNSDVLAFFGGRGNMSNSAPAVYPARNTGVLSFLANEAWTPTAWGTYATVGITPNGSTTRINAVMISSKTLANGGGGLLRISGDNGVFASIETKARLDVNGSAITRTVTYDLALSSGSTSIDLTRSNSIAINSETCDSSCGSGVAYNLTVADGGTYTLAFQDSKSWAISFNFIKAESGNITNIKYLSQVLTRTTGKHLIMSITRIGSWVYVGEAEI